MDLNVCYPNNGILLDVMVPSSLTKEKDKTWIFVGNEGGSMEINTSGSSVKVENLPSVITNERLKEALSYFGHVERAFIITDDKGKSTTRGIVQFNSKLSAQNAVKQIQEGCFLLTTRPQPISAKIIEQEDTIYGLPEEKIIKTTEYYRETKIRPRLAKRGSFEDECCQTWKIRYILEEKKRQNFMQSVKKNRKIFEEEMPECWEKLQQQKDLMIVVKKQEIMSHNYEEERIKKLQKKEFEARKRIWIERRKMEINNSNGHDGSLVEKHMEKSMVLKTTTKKEREKEEIKCENDSIIDKNSQEDNSDSPPKILCLYSTKTSHHLSVNEEKEENEKEERQLNSANEPMIEREESACNEITQITTPEDSPASNEEMIEQTTSSNKVEFTSNRSSVVQVSQRKLLRKRKSANRNDEVDIEDLKEEENNQVISISSETDCEESHTKVELLEEKRTYPTRRRSRMERENMATNQNESDEIPSKKVKYNEEEEPITVSELKILKLCGLSEEQKIMLKARGRPTPKLALTQQCSRNTKMYKRTFKLHWYERKKWMCGCKESCALYCFPCILLGGVGGDLIWTNTGYTNIAKLSVRSGRHEQSRSHVNNMMYYNKLGKEKKREDCHHTDELILTDISDNDEDDSCDDCAEICKNSGVEAMKKYFSGPDGESKAKNFLQNHGLLPIQRRCDKCGNLCGYEEKTRRFRCDKKDGNGGRCRFGVSESKGTLFSNVASTYQQFTTFLFYYLFTKFHRSDLEGDFHRTSTTITRWYTNLNEICIHYMKKKQSRIGGSDIKVDIDEIFVCKRLDVGIRREYWILRGTEHVTDRKFYYHFEGQPRFDNDFIQIIGKFVRPGTSIITDNHSRYSELCKHGYKVNMIDGMGTRTANQVWDDLKYYVNKRGQKTDHMQLYICRYILIKSFQSRAVCLHRFLQSAASFYPLP